jgi:hypothetical protein
MQLPDEEHRGEHRDAGRQTITFAPSVTLGPGETLKITGSIASVYDTDGNLRAVSRCCVERHNA